MLKFRIDRDVVLKAVRYHAEESRGIQPVIETDHDLLEWVHWCLCDLGGLEPGTDEIFIQVDAETVVIGGDAEVLDTARSHIL